MNYVRPLIILILSITVGIFYLKKKKKILDYRNPKSFCFLNGPIMWFPYLAIPGASRPGPNPQTCHALSLGTAYTVIHGKDSQSGRHAPRSQLFS